MYTLETFRKSKTWQKFVKNLKSERTNEEGMLICAHCGKPILKKYDCIGHHKVELTEQNVNNFDVSLNPDLIDLVHHKCHNDIHEHFGCHQQRVYIIYGPPLSGKTTYAKSVMSAGDLVLDMDNIWQCVSGLERYNKPNALKEVVFDVRNKILEDVKHRRGFWHNAYIIGGYPLQGERQRLEKQLGAESIYIEIEKEKNLERICCLEDARKQKDYERFILGWWEKYRPNE